MRLKCRNIARHAGRHSISRHEGALKRCTYTHMCAVTHEHAKTVVHAFDLTSPSWHVNFYSPLWAPCLETSLVSHGCKHITIGLERCSHLSYNLKFGLTCACIKAGLKPLPWAVSTVDCAAERQVVVHEVDLSLLRDADLFEHGIWHFIIHFSCTRKHNFKCLKRTNMKTKLNAVKGHLPARYFRNTLAWENYINLKQY